MFTSDRIGLSSPASSAALSALVFNVGDVAGIFDGDAFDGFVGELPSEKPEVFSQTHERPQARCLLG